MEMVSFLGYCGRWGVKKFRLRVLVESEFFCWAVAFFKYRIRRRPIFPGGYPPSIVGDESLYDRVRDGNGWCPFSLSPKNFCCLLKVVWSSGEFFVCWKLHNDG